MSSRCHREGWLYSRSVVGSISWMYRATRLAYRMGALSAS